MDSWIEDKLGDRNPQDIQVQDLELSVRVLHCFKNEGIHTLQDLVAKTEAELLRTPNLGRRSLGEIVKVLGEFGLELRPSSFRSIDEQMTQAIARVRAAKVAYAEAALDVQRLAKQMADTDLGDIVPCVS